MKDFLEFAAGTGLGVVKAASSDHDVFLMAVTGGLLGCRSPRLRGLGKALGMLVIARRADQYVSVLDSKLAAIAQIMHEGNHPLIVTHDGHTETTS